MQDSQFRLLLAEYLVGDEEAEGILGDFLEEHGSRRPPARIGQAAKLNYALREMPPRLRNLLACGWARQQLRWFRQRQLQDFVKAHQYVVARTSDADWPDVVNATQSSADLKEAEVQFSTSGGGNSSDYYVIIRSVFYDDVPMLSRLVKRKRVAARSWQGELEAQLGEAARVLRSPPQELELDVFAT